MAMHTGHTRWLTMLVLPLLALGSGCGSDARNPASSQHDAYVSAVRNGHFSSHPAPAASIGVVFDRYLGESHWESIVGADGLHYVNVTGRMTYQGKPTTALIQFRVNLGAGSFEMSALEFNGIAQSQLMILVLIADIYNEAG